MFLFYPIHFLKIWGKSQPQRSYKNGSYIYKKKSVLGKPITYPLDRDLSGG